jgi:hypothetical protein
MLYNVLLGSHCFFIMESAISFMITGDITVAMMMIILDSGNCRRQRIRSLNNNSYIENKRTLLFTHSCHNQFDNDRSNKYNILSRNVDGI